MAIKMPTTLILSGGFGTRIRAAIGSVPKVMAPIHGTPFIAYLLSFLSQQNMKDVVLCTGYLGTQLLEYCGDGSRFGLNLKYSEEPVPLGTGGAIKFAEKLINSDSFIVLNGDSFMPEISLPNLLSFHLNKNSSATLTLTEVTDKERYGAVVIGKDKSILRFQEKNDKGNGLINAGIYVFNKGFLDEIPVGRAVSLETDILPEWLKKRSYGYVTNGPFIDIGTVESYHSVCELEDSVFQGDSHE